MRWENCPENFLREIERAASCLELAVGEFENMLTYAGHFGSDPLMANLHLSLTTPALDPELLPPAVQVELAREKVGNALSSVKAAVEGSDNAWVKGWPELEVTLSRLLELPPPRWVRITTYADDPPRKVDNLLPVYIWEDSPPSLPALRKLLEGVGEDLSRLQELREVELPDLSELKDLLKVRIPLTPVSRETLYKLAPPVVSPAGIGVFHELRVSGVSYFREDPAGVLGLSTATPVPLPYLNICLWWGQWKTRIEIEGGVEEVFDVQNPVLLQETELGYLHMPLSRRLTLANESFELTTAVVSLKPFSITEA
jgi:hypothetical protein